MTEGNAILHLWLDLQHSAGNGNGADAFSPEDCARSSGRCNTPLALAVDFFGSGRNYWWAWWWWRRRGWALLRTRLWVGGDVCDERVAAAAAAPRWCGQWTWLGPDVS